MCYPFPVDLFCTDWLAQTQRYDTTTDSSGTADWGDLQVQVVPEPAAAALLLAGLGLLGAVLPRFAAALRGRRPAAQTRL